LNESYFYESGLSTNYFKVLKIAYAPSEEQPAVSGSERKLLRGGTALQEFWPESSPRRRFLASPRQ
jgi:hypothetical protein